MVLKITYYYAEDAILDCELAVDPHLIGVARIFRNLSEGAVDLVSYPILVVSVICQLVPIVGVIVDDKSA